MRERIRILYTLYKNRIYPGRTVDYFTRLLFFLLRGRIDLLCKVYFNQIINLATFDARIIQKLRDTFYGEGCLLDNSINDFRVTTQINFLTTIIKQTKAKRILETGTHKAMFCYVACRCNSSITVDTFGDLPETQEAIDVLNQKYGERIRFYLGDSRETLRDFSPDYQIDFAWIDGGHSFEVCLSDLISCARLRIPNIAIDDYRLIADVREAVDEFIKKYDYVLTATSNVMDYRGIAYLTK